MMMIGYERPWEHVKCIKREINLQKDYSFTLLAKDTIYKNVSQSSLTTQAAKFKTDRNFQRQLYYHQFVHL